MPTSRLRARTLAACVSLAALFSFPAAARADIRPIVTGICECRGMGVSSGGTIYLTDRVVPQIHKLDAAGQHLGTWRSGGGLNLDTPGAALELPNGDVAIPDYDAGVIHVVTSSGAFVRDIGSGQVADAVAGPDGTLYAVGYDSVRRIGPDDAVQAWPMPWSGVDPWPLSRVARAIALSPANGHLYVLDGGESVIHEVTTTGAHVRQFGGFGNAPGQLNAPNDIAVDSAGDVYVAQPNMMGTGAAVTIKKFSGDGAYLGELVRHEPPIAIAAVGDVLYALDGPPTNGVTRIDLRSPIAKIGVIGAFLKTSQQYTFDASLSWMPFGTVTRYEWDFDGDGSFEVDAGTTPTATHRFTTAGGRAVRLRVTGSSGATDVVAQDVGIHRSSAHLRASAPRALIGEQVRFDASDQGLPNSEIENVRWDLDGDGSYEFDSGRSLVTSRSWAAAGTQTVGIRIERSGGVLDAASARVTVVEAPPTGSIGVTINDGARYTNDPRVTLNVVWPPFAAGVLISNDGGFRTAVGRPISRQIEWTLVSSGPERLPKQVRLRFDGSAQTYADGIVLDRTAPVVQSAASVSGRRGTSRYRRHQVRVKATDTTSGVAKLQFAVSRRKPTAAVGYRRSLTIRGARPRFVRAIDRAGNVSRWKALR